jgi:bifunctional aspartokinase / homoserine dehydrogenase 1
VHGILRDTMVPAKRSRSRPPVVHKFGGASLADAEAVRHAITLVQAQPPGPAVVVVSAMAGVTDALLDLGRRALTGGRDEAARVERMALVDALKARHEAVVKSVVPRGPIRQRVLADVARAHEALVTLLDGVASLRELTPRTNDFLLSRGEKLSALMVAAGLEAAGTNAQYVKATTVILTDGVHGGAFPNLAATEKAARAVLGPLLRAGVVPVVPGFLGASPDGTVTTLGRGGSDLTATVLARVLGADSVHLWKDVPGLLTTDPRIVPSARVIPQLNVREASELAYYGAKVLHPRALIPLARTATPVHVRPFGDPASTGTEISSRRTLQKYPVKALSMVRQQALVTVTGNGMLGVPGIAARTFTALQRTGVSVSFITQASSEHAISLCIPAESAEAARAALDAEFATERLRREIERIDVRAGVAMVAVVGLGMAGTRGLAARVFTSLGRAGINIVAIAQGSSELNITVVIDEVAAPDAVRAVHAEFQLDKIGGGAAATSAHVDVVLFGFGQIGREFTRLLGRGKARTMVRVVAVCDRSGLVFDAEGLSARRLAALAAHKEAGQPLARADGGQRHTGAAAVQTIARHALSHPVLVDVTADDTSAAIDAALACGFDIVLANKRPLSAPRATVDAMHATARANGRRILFETTVGAGLPVMDTYAKLVDAGDRVTRIEGCTSGTLGFLLTEIGRGRAFSDAVRRAMAKGYTEPDPRDDLSGMDVARKALILGRMLGYRGELDGVEVESLVPESARALSRDAFVAGLEAYDDDWRGRQAAAERANAVLRYVLTVTSRKITVGLRAVDRSHPLAGLRGTDNQIVFTTPRYLENPLAITGPGAGPAVTAAGVLNDVLKLAGA